MSLRPTGTDSSQQASSKPGAVQEDCNNELWILMHLDLRNTVRVKTVYQLMLEELGQASSLFAGAAE